MYIKQKKKKMCYYFTLDTQLFSAYEISSLCFIIIIF